MNIERGGLEAEQSSRRPRFTIKRYNHNGALDKDSRVNSNIFPGLK